MRGHTSSARRKEKKMAGRSKWAVFRFHKKKLEYLMGAWNWPKTKRAWGMGFQLAMTRKCDAVRIMEGYKGKWFLQRL